MNNEISVVSSNGIVGEVVKDGDKLRASITYSRNPDGCDMKLTIYGDSVDDLQWKWDCVLSNYDLTNKEFSIKG